MSLRSDEVDVFEASRHRLAAVAYRLLGSAAEAEDAVQETFLRWQGADRDRIEVPEAWLTKVLTNLCLNQLASARARREAYIGQWLPEPVLDGDPMLGPADTAEQRESVSLAVLRLMERLSPKERAVYVLHEAFGHTHREIAEFLEISESGSQQLLSRARRRVATGRVRTEIDRATARKVVEEFLSAAATGEVEALVRVLSEDALGIGDGGGRIPTRRDPILGATALAKFLRGLFKPTETKRDMLGGRPDVYPAVVNGAPALVVAVGDRVASVIALEMSEGRVSEVLNQSNPEKLARVNERWRAGGPHGEPLIAGW